MFIDPLYLLLMIPGLLLATWASISVKSAFAKYSQVRASSGMTGADVAAEILQRNHIFDVTVEESHGFLSDHYDPRSRTVRLSPAVYREASVASVAIAAHEVGHALQHAKAYAPLQLRSMAVPLARFGSYAPWIILIGGFVLHSLELVYVGIALFAVTVLFQLITLPVEFNASRRAHAQLETLGLVSRDDAKGVRKVLSAAAMTYVAAAISALLTLLYYLIRLGLIGNRRS
ncbi:MAG: zinc metallopeptidase [Proteobacteria bacterium]|nr:zinc metallopeptidase [Pseudomonadota bacterium]